MNWEVVDQNEQARIKVIGVGGAGGNAVIHMINHDIKGVDFICANTDTQALKRADGATSLKLGSNLTKGLGAGANPEIGRQAAEGAAAAQVKGAFPHRLRQLAESHRLLPRRRALDEPWVGAAAHVRLRLTDAARQCSQPEVLELRRRGRCVTRANCYVRLQGL